MPSFSAPEDDAPTGLGGLVIAYIFVGFFGAIISFLVVNQLGGQDQIIRSLGLYDYWVIFAGMIGAVSGLFAGRNWLGKPGLRGWTNAMVAVPIISFMSSLVGGTLALPIYGTMFGPLALISMFFENPMILILWIWTLLLAHYQYANYVGEKDTLFERQNGEYTVVRLRAAG